MVLTGFQDSRLAGLPGHAYSVDDDARFTSVAKPPGSSGIRYPEIRDNLVYVGFQSNPGWIAIYNIDNPERMRLVGDTSVGNIGANLPHRIQPVGDYLYSGLNGGALLVVDISNPQNPFQVAIEGYGNQTFDTDVVGDFAFLADGAGFGIAVMDISDPTNPQQTDSASFGVCGGVRADNNWVYATDFSGNSLRIYERDNPETVSLESNTGVGFTPVPITLQGNIAVVQEYQGTTAAIVDVTDRSNPSIESTITFPSQIANSGSVRLDGDILYETTGQNTDGSLAAWDISNLSSPSLLARWNWPGGPNLVGFDVTDNYFFVANRTDDVLYQVKNPLVWNREVTLYNLIIQNELDVVGDITYSPGDSADWNGDPATIQEAVDRMASVIADNHGSIP